MNLNLINIIQEKYPITVKYYCKKNLTLNKNSTIHHFEIKSLMNHSQGRKKIFGSQIFSRVDCILFSVSSIEQFGIM